jgi:hypothetical protein
MKITDLKQEAGPKEGISKKATMKAPNMNMDKKEQEAILSLLCRVCLYNNVQMLSRGGDTSLMTTLAVRER